MKKSNSSQISHFCCKKLAENEVNYLSKNWNLVEKRRKARRTWQQTRNSSNKREFNKLNNKTNQSIKEYSFVSKITLMFRVPKLRITALESHAFKRPYHQLKTVKISKWKRIVKTWNRSLNIYFNQTIFIRRSI